MVLSAPKNKTVLVVDDDPFICDFFKTILQVTGYNVHVVSGGPKALPLLQNKKQGLIHLVVLDLMMPDMEGYEVLKELQKPDYYYVHILIVTARAMDQATRDKLNVEPNVRGIMTKPVDPKEFLGKIGSILGVA